MARKARIEYAGAYYHVINRGNYRSWIFESEGARESFLNCLKQTCESMQWRLHGWCLMGNHYHLCIQTQAPNLVEGMKWLQSTFANRFNRFRKSNGHVFQGRYKAILLDGDAVAQVCHYIHLNPVRAGLLGVGELENFSDSSFHQLWYARKRWSFSVVESYLEAAGGLKDTRAGRKLYRDYLSWLSEEEGERKRMGFDKMTRGWANGTKEFKDSVLEDFKDSVVQTVVESEASEMREPRWEQGVRRGLKYLGKKEADLKLGPKAALWKVALARSLREGYLAPYSWIANRLHMGRVSSLSSVVSRSRKMKKADFSEWEQLINHENLD
jgi:REP element-mobilizing transposase RayT